MLYEQTVMIGEKLLQEGDWLSLNGSSGEVILGKQPLSPPALSGDLGTFMSWVDDVRQLKVNLRNNEIITTKTIIFSG
jgi:pyruvate, orthophosphate dikinase